ncbi:MAG: putative zinc-binding peptidase [Pseudomonadota bacterium]
MRTFHCEHCDNTVYFDNTVCTRCQHMLGVLPEILRVCALEPAGDGTWTALTSMAAGARYRQCENYAVHAVCNWMVPAASGQRFCIACRHNHTIPNLSRPDFAARWYRLERSKRRLIYSLLKLGLPLQTKAEDPLRGLAFSFLSDLDAAPGSHVVTGHHNGHITISIDEADPSLRERQRIDLEEKYRTLLGHFRHESGHYYWDRLIRDTPLLAEFRTLFGDEGTDYAQALDAYYRAGAVADWENRFISRYASAHPWEDWAESWAHYLHIIDTLETAGHYGVRVNRVLPGGSVHRADPRFDAYRFRDFDTIIRHWLPLTHALNSLNRSMGLPDLYPFTLPEPALHKLAFVHRTVQAQRRFDVGYAQDRDVDRPLGVWLLRRLAGRVYARLQAARA